jgi:hypothetical protein
MVHTLSDIPACSEMEKICFMESLPGELTYPAIRELFPVAIKKQQGIGCGGACFYGTNRL